MHKLSDDLLCTKVAAWRDMLPGGLADKKKPADFEQAQLAKGTKAETEHVSNKATAKEISMDHLVEDPKYYDKLEKMESKHAAETDAPNYKKAGGSQTCSNCSYSKKGHCVKYGFDTIPSWTCDAWEGSETKKVSHRVRRP